MNYRFLIVFLLLINEFELHAQEGKQIGVFEDDLKSSFKVKPKLDVKLDTRFSFISANDIRTTGAKLGLSFNHKFKTGLGYNQLIYPSRSFLRRGNQNIKVELNYKYISPYFEYIYYTSRKWEFNLSTQFGFGQAYYQYYDNETASKKKTGYSFILSYEPSMLIDYKIIRWFGVGTGVGYRLILFKNKNISEKLTSPVYIFKLKIYLGEIVRTLTGKEIQAE